MKRAGQGEKVLSLAAFRDSMHSILESPSPRINNAFQLKNPFSSYLCSAFETAFYSYSVSFPLCFFFLYCFSSTLMFSLFLCLLLFTSLCFPIVVSVSSVRSTTTLPVYSSRPPSLFLSNLLLPFLSVLRIFFHLFYCLASIRSRLPFCLEIRRKL